MQTLSLRLNHYYAVLQSMGFRSKSMITLLLHCFTTDGFPQVIKLDNRSLHTSYEFAFFLLEPIP